MTGVMTKPEYPNRQTLTESDRLGVLSVGPDLDWFVPFAVLGEVRTTRPNEMRYGVVHWYLDAEGNRRCDQRTFYSEEGARWAMEALYRRHRADCRCLAVFYWTPAMVNYGAGFGA